ncbi:MAG: hypothetical protein KDA41_00545 [Planctomycetales bacterium]|nr:hypothetical protein [Planctomycetales bacterium]
MRWLFCEPTNRSEVARRAQTLRAIDAWWNAFAERRGQLAAYFSGDDKWDLPQWMHEHLGAVHPDLMWEFGPAARGEGHRLVITPEGRRWLRPLVRTLLERAPRLPDWEFYDQRLPDDIQWVRACVQGRTGVDAANVQAQVRVGPRRKLELVFTSPQWREVNDDVRQTALVIVEHLLGEEVLDHWVGPIEVEPPPRTGLLGKLLPGRKPAPSGAWLPLDRLRATAMSLIESVRSQLTAAPWHETIDDESWSTLQLKPREAPDYAGRDDLLVAVTCCLELFQAAHSGELFHSDCHSRCGETFCYVKIDGGGATPAAGNLPDRAALEDALNAALISRKLGCAIGGGTGLRYSYIDLALGDLRAGVNAVRDVLQAAGVPERAWVLFYDDELSQEWVGVYESSPAPLLPETD